MIPAIQAFDKGNTRMPLLDILVLLENAVVGSMPATKRILLEEKSRNKE
jgi:hypothetical protein